MSLKLHQLNSSCINIQRQLYWPWLVWKTTFAHWRICAKLKWDFFSSSSLISGICQFLYLREDLNFSCLLARWCMVGCVHLLCRLFCVTRLFALSLCLFFIPLLLYPLCSVPLIRMSDLITDGKQMFQRAKQIGLMVYCKTFPISLSLLLVCAPSHWWGSQCHRAANSSKNNPALEKHHNTHTHTNLCKRVDPLSWEMHMI